MKIVMTRHFQTPGNLLGRYIGTTDEDLIPEAKAQIHIRYPEVERVYASPLKRCLQTAALLYPKKEPVICSDFRECDFGRFENKNYQELSGDAAYQAWIDSNGTLPFPEGESNEDFRTRCCKAFEAVIDECIKENVESVAIVVHGGTIMSILSAFDEKAGSFYDYQVKNGQGYMMHLANEEWLEGRHVLKAVTKLE